MLILTRSIGQSIFIGDHIVVKLHGVTAEGETVRLAITAPKEIKIQRAETRNEKGPRAGGPRTK